MQNLFSSRQRNVFLQQMQSSQIDVLVIGGGITGAGIALDAQARGMQTALVEMQDFAAGTSSRSTKLVHGGLRYLKQLEFKLVAEVGRERAIVYENGPHVTKAEPMLLPLVKGGTLGKFGASVGLRLYDILAGVKSTEQRKMLSRQQTLEREPLLRKELLLGGAFYYEYRTDDARLTIEILKEAVSRGTLALNYLKVTGFLYKDNRITGVKVQDQLTGETYEIMAKKVVNATGPWVDILDGINEAGKDNKLHITKGVHMVLDHTKLPIQQAIYFDAPDKRMIFAIPRNGKTYIGTTDTSYTGDLANPQLSETDIQYLIGAVQDIFPEANVKLSDIESSWVGLRPLIRQPGKGPTDISRKDEIFQYASGLITIAGGKLTGYRKMAERIVNLLATQFKKEAGRNFSDCTTNRIPVSGGKVGGSAGFMSFVKEKTKLGQSIGLTENESRKLAQMYGSNVDKLFERIRQADKISTVGLNPVLLAQLRYSIEEEMAATPADFFIRRTGALYFDIAWVEQWQGTVITYMADYFQWDITTLEGFKKELQSRIMEAKGKATVLQTLV